MGIFSFLNKKSKFAQADTSTATGKDFEILIQGDIDVYADWDNVMTPKSMKWEKLEKNNWTYYMVGDDEYCYSIESPGIQMTFNQEVSYSKAKQIADEIIENIKETGQEANLVVLNTSNIYKF